MKPRLWLDEFNSGTSPFHSLTLFVVFVPRRKPGYEASLGGPRYRRRAGERGLSQAIRVPELRREFPAPQGLDTNRATLLKRVNYVGTESSSHIESVGVNDAARTGQPQACRGADDGEPVV